MHVLHCRSRSFSPFWSRNASLSCLVTRWPVPFPGCALCGVGALISSARANSHASFGTNLLSLTRPVPGRSDFNSPISLATSIASYAMRSSNCLEHLIRLLYSSVVFAGMGLFSSHSSPGMKKPPFRCSFCVMHMRPWLISLMMSNLLIHKSDWERIEKATES